MEHLRILNPCNELKVASLVNGLCDEAELKTDSASSLTRTKCMLGLDLLVANKFSSNENKGGTGPRSKAVRHNYTDSNRDALDVYILLSGKANLILTLSSSAITPETHRCRRWMQTQAT